MYDEKEIMVYRKGEVHLRQDAIVIETPLTLLVNNQELATLLCSPQACKELGVGFLLNEGMISKPTDISTIEHDLNQGILYIEGKIASPGNSCGRKRYYPQNDETTVNSFYYTKDAQQIEPVKSDFCITANRLLQLISLLEEKSLTFRQTGGVHIAALADNSGLIVSYEDIGRHNAVDKVLGYAFLNTIPLDDKCLILSGRIASEILIKAARQKIPLVLSRSATMLLAVELAKKLGICMVGFTRGQQFNVYCHANRIVF